MLFRMWVRLALCSSGGESLVAALQVCGVTTSPDAARSRMTLLIHSRLQVTRTTHLSTTSRNDPLTCRPALSAGERSPSNQEAAPTERDGRAGGGALRG